MNKYNEDEERSLAMNVKLVNWIINLGLFFYYHLFSMMCVLCASNAVPKSNIVFVNNNNKVYQSRTSSMHHFRFVSFGFFDYIWPNFFLGLVMNFFYNKFIPFLMIFSHYWANGNDVVFFGETKLISTWMNIWESYGKTYWKLFYI